MLKKEKIECIKKGSQRLQREINKRVFSYITAGFGLVAGLAWNEAIKAFIEYFFPLSQNTIVAKFIYALIMTAVLVVISVYLAKIFEHETEKK